MTHETAKYLSGIAKNSGIINWSIGQHIGRSDDDPNRYTFNFEGVGNLPRLKERILPGIAEKLDFGVDIEGDAVRIR